MNQLVAKARGVLRAEDLGDLAKVYERLGLPKSDVMSNLTAGSALYERIRKAMEWTDKSTAVRLEDLERHLVLRHLADGAPVLEGVSLVFNLKEATRMVGWRAPPLTEESRWLQALGAAKDYHRVHGRPIVDEPHISARERSVARAVVTLRAHGFRVTVEGGRVVISEAERRRFVDRLERAIAELGGVEFAAHLFDRMSRWYDAQQGRHHAVRRLSTTGTNDGLPVTPVGYLLNLAAKNIEPRPPREDWAEQARQTIELAEAFVDLFDLRQFSSFEALFKDHETVLPFLREIVLYDSAYGLVQTRPADVKRVLNGLFDWVPPTEKLGKGWTVTELSEVAAAVAALCRELRGPGLISASQVSKHIGSRIAPDAVRDILDACSHAPAEVNSSYAFPWDQTEATLWMKPLIRDTGGYLVMDPSWCFPAFYDVVAAELEALANYQVSRHVGPALERLVQGELRRRGVAFATGQYRVNGIEGECDLVVETASTIILIEMKKRPLQRAAKGGDPVALLADLSEALFYAQEQAARHELVLYRDGQLVLTDGSVTHTIPLAGRAVERVALVHPDYGSLQDRLVLFQVLRLLSGASLKATDPTMQPLLSRLEARGKRLLERHEELDKLRPPHEHNPFHHCWFLSLGHLLIMLDHVDSNEGFWRELRKSRSMTTGSLDFYFEYAQARRIRGSGTSSGSVIVRSSPP
jgi:hypothetical protein